MSVYTRPEHVAYVVDGDGAVVLDMETGAYVGLSAHATRIWQLVLTLRAAEPVVAALVAEFPGTDEGVVRRDVTALLDELVTAGLLDRVED